jgi:hypothetical protein
MRAASLAAAVILVACGRETPQKEPPLVATATAPALVMEYEGVTLGSTLDELIAMAADRGWRQNAHPGAGDQTVTVFTTPDHPVKRYRLGFEGGALINIQIDFRTPDPARAALRGRFTVGKQIKDTWYLTDRDRQILASVDERGAAMKALWLARMRDQTEAKAMLKVTVDAEPPR